MKVQERVLDVTSTLEGEKVGMSIDTSALSHIMGVLTDLYSDPELAVIREYSTNAFDAHVEAGVKRPIEVTTPTSLAPFFKVRDFGEGLNAGDIREIYSRYGASTKRASDDVVGMLGLGCKSALTYTDQFTITGIKYGIKTQVVVSRDEDGAGSMTIVDQCKTEDIQGVEIVVPVNISNKFEEKANKFFRFWQKDKVLINGAKPTPISGIWIADDMLLTDEVDEAFVVMGNVPYPVVIDRDSQRYSSYRVDSSWWLVTFVGIGEINFVPSREALQMTSRTKTTLANIKEREKLEKIPALVRIVESSPTRHEAVSNYFKCRSLGLTDKVKWHGNEIPGKFEGIFVSVDLHAYYRSKGWSVVKEVVSNTQALWLTGYEGESFTPHRRKKLDKWIMEKKLGDTSRSVILTKELPANKEWIDKSKVFPWQEVKDTMIEKEGSSPRADGRPTGSYDAFVAGTSQRGIPADSLSRTELFYVHASIGGNWHSRPGGIDSLLLLHPNATLVTLQKNRINKFIRDFPMAKELNEYLKNKAIEWKDSIDVDDRIAYHIQDNYSYNDFKKLDKDLVADPELKKLIILVKRDVKTLRQEIKNWSNWIRLDDFDKSEWVCPLDKYPLLANLDLTYASQPAIVDAYVYLNAAYKARQGRI